MYKVAQVEKGLQEVESLAQMTRFNVRSRPVVETARHIQILRSILDKTENSLDMLKYRGY